MRNFLTRTVLIGALLSVGNAHAQTEGATSSHNLIAAGTLSDSSGSIAVNTSAGVGNAQANVAAISVSKDVAISGVRNQQEATSYYQARHGVQSSEIGRNAFANTSGVIAVNQSSGNANTQANLVAIAAGRISETSIDQLSHVRAQQEMPSNLSQDTNQYRRSSASIADSAFSGAQGLVQINQLAGSGNNTANIFTLSLGVGK